MSCYRAVIERDEDGYWFADFPEVPGCHTQGRTLRAVRSRLRDALATCVDDGEDAEIVEDLRLPDEAWARLQRSGELRAEADRLEHEAAEATREAARGLVAAGLPLRDAGDLLGLSFQRVAQLVDERDSS